MSALSEASRSNPKEPASDARDLSVTSDLWGDEEGVWYGSDWVNWTQHPEVKRRINRLVARREDWDVFMYWIKAYLEEHLPVGRALSLGCGIGGLERGLAKYGFAQDHLGVDVSQGAVEQARRLAEEQGLDGLRYEVADLNVAELEPDSFDVILGVSAIHHVAELERLFEQICWALKPNGLLLMDEFVGPVQFQWLPHQIELATRVLRMLPKRYRKSARMPGTFKEYVAVHTIEQMNEVDPTESIRSDEILPLVRQYFHVIEQKGYGGTLLHLILDDIVGNFHPEDETANSLLHMIFEIEDQAIASGELDHDFCTLVARKRSLVPRLKHERLSRASIEPQIGRLGPR